MYGAQVPLVVFGVIALLAALLVTFMPETSKTPLPDTIQVTRTRNDKLCSIKIKMINRREKTDMVLIRFSL